MHKSIGLLALAFTLSSCQSSSRNAESFDPCKGVRDLDPHCGWTPHWNDMGPTVNPIDGTKTEFLSLESSDPDGETLGRLTYAELRICFENGKLCGGNRVKVGVTVNGMVQPLSYEETHSTPVRVRFDTEKPVRQTWGIADSNDALFPQGREKQFLAQLLNHNKLFLEFSYYEHAPRTVAFDLSDLADKMKSVGGK
jgi:hypothetical protein